MDRLDRKILRLLQEDATLAVADVAKKVGLSTTPCWRRIQKMEEDGVIKGRVAVLDPVKINAGVTVFVSIRTNEHNEVWMRKFAAVVDDFTRECIALVADTSLSGARVGRELDTVITQRGRRARLDLRTLRRQPEPAGWSLRRRSSTND